MSKDFFQLFKVFNMNDSKIYVGNLSYEVNSDDLHDFFSQYGELAEVKLITDRETGRSKGFAFLSFATGEAAQAALAANGVDLKGRNMKVNMAKEDNRRRGGGGAGGGGGRRQTTDSRW